MSKFIVGAPSDSIYMALHQAGVFKEDPTSVRRVIIDLECGSPARVYVELFADSSLTDVLMEGSIKIVEAAE